MKKIIFILFAVVQSLISLAQPANDDPCGAISLTVQTGTLCTPSNPYSWTGATATAGIPDPGCGSYLTGDIWFSFIAPASGQANINTAAGSGGGAITDGAMAVYYNPSPCSVLAYALYACDDDSGPGNMPALNLTGLLPGIKYYIRFWDFFDATSGNIGGICVTNPNPPLATTGAVGIGIQNPDNLLDVNGVVKIRGGNPGLNKVLISDASGVASWSSLPAAFNPVPFKATNSVDQIIGTSVIFGLTFNTEEYDPDNNFSSSSFFTPADGIYHFDATVIWFLSGVTSASILQLILAVNGSNVHIISVKIPATTSGAYSETISADISLTSSQTVTLKVYQDTGVNQLIGGNSGSLKDSYFNGHRIK